MDKSDECAVFFKGRGQKHEQVLLEAEKLTKVAGPGVVPLLAVSTEEHVSTEYDPGKRSSRHAGQHAAPAVHVSTEYDPGKRSSTKSVSDNKLPRKGSDVFLVLEEAACSLADVLCERGPMSAPEVRGVAVAAAEALGRVHSAGLVHGDIKPANLLLNYEGVLWLADFDASVQADGRPLARGSTQRVLSYSRATVEVDVRALALALVELATGVVVDPRVKWTANDLRRLGCSVELGADIACVFGMGREASARFVVDIFSRHGERRLPEPATTIRFWDPTPTVEFKLVHASSGMQSRSPF